MQEVGITRLSVQSIRWRRRFSRKGECAPHSPGTDVWVTCWACCTPCRRLLSTKRAWQPRRHPHDWSIIVETYEAQVQPQNPTLEWRRVRSAGFVLPFVPFLVLRLPTAYTHADVFRGDSSSISHCCISGFIRHRCDLL